MIYILYGRKMLIFTLLISILSGFKQKLAFPIEGIMDKVCIFSENVDRLQQSHTDSAFLSDLSYVAHHSCQLVSSEYMMQKPRSERLALTVKIYRILIDDSSD